MRDSDRLAISESTSRDQSTIWTLLTYWAEWRLLTCFGDDVMIPLVSIRLITRKNSRVPPVPGATMGPRALREFLVQLEPRALRDKWDRAARTGVQGRQEKRDPQAHQGRETLNRVSTRKRLPLQWRQPKARLRTLSCRSRRWVVSQEVNGKHWRKYQGHRCPVGTNPTLWLPRVIKFKFLLQPHQWYYTQPVWRIGFL